MYRWLYIDFNSFFASVEQQLNPKLRGQPVAVVPADTDATSVIAASYEAKKFGIKTGTPVYEAKRMCPSLICVHSNHAAYGEFHDRILVEIDRHIPVSLVCSIDEMACELMDNERDRVDEIAAKIKRGLRENIGECMTCSIGVAPNRYLAKIATDMQKPDGFTMIDVADLPMKLSTLKLRDLPGVGAAMEERLFRHKIVSVSAFWNLDPAGARKAWGSVVGEKIWYELHGYNIPEPEERVRKSLGRSKVLPPEQRAPEEARIVLRQLASDAASRLRKNDVRASALSVYVDEFESHCTFDSANDTLSILKIVYDAWREINPKGPIKKIGVTFHMLETTDQSTLLSNSKGDRLSKALDQIKERYGYDL